MADCTAIQLGNGLVALIDTCYESLVCKFKWYVIQSAPRNGYYAMARLKIETTNIKITLYMHRLITNAPHGKVVDHINHDTLDNRRANLRVGSHLDNMRNGVRAMKTHCLNGHEFTPDNIILKADGRNCRTCDKLRRLTPNYVNQQKARSKAYRIRKSLATTNIEAETGVQPVT